jgi:hypothetical protein
MERSRLIRITMRDIKMLLSMVPSVLILFAESALAGIVNINMTIELSESQIYDCGGGAYPVGTMCWTNFWSQSTLDTPVTVNPSEDTVRIQLNFAGPWRMRWETDGISVPVFGDESVQVGASGQGDCCSGPWDNSLSFLGVKGDLNHNPLEWSLPVDASSGGIVSQSYHSGLTNLTDSFFEFDGIVSTIGPYPNGSSQPYIIERVSIFFTSGVFHILRVPEPVPIDIKPSKKTDLNVIDLKKDKKLKVAIVGSESFDALQVDPATVKFGPSEQSPKRYKIKDYNHDGFSDLVLTFQPNETGIACGDTSATLTGETYGGVAVQGSDIFTVTPCP